MEHGKNKYDICKEGTAVQKKIAIISSQYFWLPEETGPTRFYSIAEVFQQYGYDVTVITSSFEHHEKVQRDMSLFSPFHIIYVDCPSYKKNVDVRREYSNFVFACKIKKILEYSGAFDIIYCSLPPNNISKVVGRYCQKKHIPFIADIEDLWPEAMKMIVDKPLISRCIFYPYYRDAEATYKYVDGVVGTSEEYSLRAIKYSRRYIPYRTVYVGCDIKAFDKEVEENIYKVVKPDGEIWVTYAGTIGYSYAIDCLVKTGKLLKEAGEKKVKIKILGSGPLKNKLKNMAMIYQLENVEFLGYVEHSLMAAILVKSDILVNSFAKGASQSIVNKIGDYLAAGKPMINTLENEEFCKLVDEYQFGINIEAENPKKLARMIYKLRESKKMTDIFSKNARKTAELKFDRKTSYQEILGLAEEVIQKSYTDEG